MAREPEPNLAWEAFLYVTGELDEAATLAFEERLLDDQEARDAVTRSVELIQVVRQTPPAAQPRRRHRRTLALTALLALAAATVVAVGLWFRPTTSDGSRDQNSSSIALAWSDVREGAGHPLVDAGLTDGVEASGSEVEVEIAAPASPPSWMLSAALVRTPGSTTEEN